MGIFGRDDADDLYRGDAPVSQPGRDGAEPVGYHGGSPAGDRAAADRPSRAAFPAPGPGIPATKKRPTRPGCLLAVVLVALVIFGGAGLVIFAIFQSASSSTSASGPAASSANPSLTITSDDGDLVVTLLGATAQPGGAWHGDNFDPAPNFVVELSLELVNASSESVITSMVGWRFVPANGSVPIEPTESGGYRPSMIYPRLAPNVVSSGYLAFPTTANSGTLSVMDSTGRLAQWELTASTPSAIVATAGEPARGEVGLPAFTVTLESTANTDSNPGLLGLLAEPGVNYLVADLTVTSLGEPSTDFIRREEFVFTATDGPAIDAAPRGAIDDDAVLIAIGNGESSPFRVAFAVPPGPGTLEMRDPAGRTVLTWQVD